MSFDYLRLNVMFFSILKCFQLSQKFRKQLNTDTDYTRIKTTAEHQSNYVFL